VDTRLVSNTYNFIFFCHNINLFISWLKSNTHIRDSKKMNCRRCGCELKNVYYKLNNLYFCVSCVNKYYKKNKKSVIKYEKQI